MGLSVLSFPLLFSCGNEPTQVVVDDANQAAQQIFATGGGESSTVAVNHTPSELGQGHVKVLEVLNASRYDYLRVSESNGKEYWLAARSGDYTVGAEYHYHDGLYKTNYHSTEFDRTFDEIYLVSGIHPVDGAENTSLSANHPPVPTQSAQVERPAESMTIAEVVRKAEELNGQEVQVTGKVIKVNPHIMNRNWIHLQDGSMDSFDFVVTTTEDIPAEHTVTLKGTLHTNRDFGAGYTYDIILENASVIR